MRDDAGGHSCTKHILEMVEVVQPMTAGSAAEQE